MNNARAEGNSQDSSNEHSITRISIMNNARAEDNSQDSRNEHSITKILWIKWNRFEIFVIGNVSDILNETFKCNKLVKNNLKNKQRVSEDSYKTSNFQEHFRVKLF